MPSIYVIDVDEYRCIAEVAAKNPDYKVTNEGKGYIRIDATAQLTFNRRELGLKPALWYGLFTGGMEGQIIKFSRETVTLVNSNR